MGEPTGPDDMDNENQMSFADMLDAYSPGTNIEIGIGDKIRGKIVSIGRDAVFVDTGTKIDGIVDKAELLDDDQQMTLAEGDELELYVVALSDEEIRLSKAVSGIGGFNMLKEAYEKQVPIEGKVLETCKGGFQVEVLQRKAFCPISQMDINYVEQGSEYVGQTLTFLILKFEERGRNIVLSRRALLAREQEKVRQQFYETLAVDAVMEGTVSRIMPYGVFVNLADGVEGMVHVSELSWSRTVEPQAVTAVGDTVRVKVIGIEPGPRAGILKIALSMKQLTEDPWLHVDDNFHEGDKLRGRVTRLANFGAFVEVAPGIEGLVHISEMSYQKRVIKPEDVVSPGEAVSVMVKQVEADKRRLSLSMRDAEGDPWIDVAEKYSVGQALEGRLEKKEKFGYFVTLEPGVTGLLPKSNLSRLQGASALEKLKPGDAVAVIVEAVNAPQRRITLAAGNTADERNWQSFAEDSRSSLGSLGEKLQRALDRKKEP